MKFFTCIRIQAPKEYRIQDRQSQVEAVRSFTITDFKTVLKGEIVFL